MISETKTVIKWDCQKEMDSIYADAFEKYFATEDKEERERITKEAGEAQAKLMIVEIDRDAEIEMKKRLSTTNV